MVRLRVTGATAEPGWKVTRIASRWRPGEKTRVSGVARRCRISRVWVPTRRPSTLTLNTCIRSPVSWIWDARVRQRTLLALIPAVPPSPASGTTGPEGMYGGSGTGAGSGSGGTGAGRGSGAGSGGRGSGGRGGSGGRSGHTSVVVTEAVSDTGTPPTEPDALATFVDTVISQSSPVASAVAREHA